MTALVLTTTSIFLCFSKHWLTQVHLENGRLNGERAGTNFGRSMTNSFNVHGR